MAAKLVAIALFAVMLSLNTGSSHAGLQVGFYNGKCNKTNVEATVRSFVTKRCNRDPTCAAFLLRMLFHDCFVHGCDASLLINGTNTEKTAPPNKSVRGYDLIDEIKAALEKACPGVVSCSDIISLATRDAVAFNGGKAYNYSVPTGRRDGSISRASDALNALPPPTITVAAAVSLFGKYGFSASDLVLLMTAHTVGVTHCSVISNRIYNYDGKGHPDPTINATLLSTLKFRCPKTSSTDNTVNLDQGTPGKVDSVFLQEIMKDYGILPIDQALRYSTLTNSTVKSLAMSVSFPSKFTAALLKMGQIQVLTGTQGKIRKVCGTA